MNTSPDNHISELSGQDAVRHSEFGSAEELIDFAQEYFSADFPNPGRVGCLGSERLSAAAGSGDLMNEELRKHLLGCSECYREFRAAMPAASSARVAAATSRRGRPAAAVARFIRDFADAPAHVFAGKGVLLPVGLFTLLIIIAGSYVLLNRRVPAPGVAMNVPAAAVATPEALPEQRADVKPESTPADDSPAKKALPAKRPNADERRSPELLARAFIKIDLQEQSELRSAEVGTDPHSTSGTGEKVIRLPQLRSRLLLSLPDNSAGGMYNVSIVDAFGRPLDTGRVRSRDGKTLIITLNLTRVPENRYHLCVAHEAEVPDCYPVFIGSRRSSPPGKEHLR
jgi:hypothetical protein